MFINSNKGLKVIKEILNNYLNNEVKTEQLEDCWVCLYKIFDIPFICFHRDWLLLVDDKSIHESKNNALISLLTPTNELQRKFKVQNSSDLDYNDIFKLYYNIILECNFLKIDSHLNILNKNINEINNSNYSFSSISNFFLKGYTPKETQKTKNPKSPKNLFFPDKENIITQLDFFNRYVLFLKNLKNILISKPEVLI